MIPIETAIQATATAATAHGFVQALEKVDAALSGDLDHLATEFERMSKDGPVPEFEKMHTIQDELRRIRESIRTQIEAHRPRAAQLQAASQQATAAALSAATGPDMAKLRAAMAVILGAG